MINLEITYLYRYRADLYKRVVMYSRTDKTGLPDILEDKPLSDHKTSDNIRRARRMIEAYALCNDWDYFGTFTLDSKIRDRSDLHGFHTDLQQFFRDQRKSTGSNIKCLLVPELHKSGDAWHMHALLHNVPVCQLVPFTLSQRLPVGIRQELLKGRQVFDWPAYRQRFGFVDLEPVVSRDRAARYIVKYIGKGAYGTAAKIAVGDHLYYVSRGLNKPEKMENAAAAPAALSLSFAQEFGLDLAGNPSTDPALIVKPLGRFEWLAPEHDTSH